MLAIIARWSLQKKRKKSILLFGLILNFVFSAPIAFASVYLLAEGSSGNCLEGFSNPMDALYFSYTTMTTLGYGDISPLGFCRLVSSTEAIFGYIFLGILSAKIYGVLNESN